MERSIELGKGLEADLEGDVRHTQRCVLQHFLRHFHPAVGHILGQGHASGLLKSTAKIKAAHMDLGSHFVQNDGFTEIFIYVVLCAGNGIVLLVAQFKNDLTG